MADDTRPKHPTIHYDHIISLIDGKPYVLLKRHLWKHGFYTAQSYREAFGLPDDYPMVPEAYSKRRSELSRQIDQSWRWNPHKNRRRNDAEC